MRVTRCSPASGQGKEEELARGTGTEWSDVAGALSKMQMGLTLQATAPARAMFLMGCAQR